MGRAQDMPAPVARVGIVDPRRIVRDRLEHSLSSDSRIEIAGTFSTWSEIGGVRDIVDVWISPHPALRPNVRSISVEDVDVTASRELGNRVVHALRASGAETGTLGASPSPELSPHERTVLEATAEGLTAAEISRQLGVSIRSVETARRRVMSKLGVNSAAEAVRRDRESHDRRTPLSSADAPRTVSG